MSGEEGASGSAPAAFAEQKTGPAREADDLPSVAIFRIVLGLAQGLALYLLYRASDDHSWPATQPQLFAPLLMVALLIPIGVSQAAGRIRADVDPAAMASILNAACQGLVLQAAWEEAIPFHAVGALLREMIRGVLLTPSEALSAPALSEGARP